MDYWISSGVSSLKVQLSCNRNGTDLTITVGGGGPVEQVIVVQGSIGDSSITGLEHM